MNIENKNVQILSIEGKDLLNNDRVVTPLSFRKASLDDSMEVDKLRSVSDDIIQINKEKKRYYTNDIISVTFKYSDEDEEVLDKNILKIKAVEKYVENLISIKTNIIKPSIKSEKNKLKKQAYINYLRNYRIITINNHKQYINELKQEHKSTRNQIREDLYVDEFDVLFKDKKDGEVNEVKHYKRYKRTSGSARVGKCLFINEKYYDEMIDWSFAGIPHDEGIDMDCAAMEAYISLPTSTAIDRFELSPENILLIDDCYSEFEDTVMATNFINEEYDKKGNVIGGDLFTDVATTKIKNNLFDGESLLDKSIFEEKGYGDRATLQMRNIFFKGIGVNTDIQQFFKDNNITKIEQLNGVTVATDISQIKIITTPSSVKYLKFGTFDNWLKHVEKKWAICKYEKPQHHFNGMVQTHYQLLNTLGMTKENMKEFLKDTIDYIKYLKEDIEVFKHYLGLNADISDEDEIEEKEKVSTNISSDNDFILNMLEMNDDFQYTNMFKNYRKDSIKSYIKNVRKGHVLVNGNYSVIVSCPYEYLLASIGKFDGESELKPFECVSNRFGIGDKLLAVRSPQPTMSNIAILNNTYNENIDKYFNTCSKEVCYISPIDNNIMELLSSLDFDGDQFLITDNKCLVESCEKLQEAVEIDGIETNRFLVSTDFTPKSAIKRSYTKKELCDVDIKCSSNLIGEIINLAQILNSLYWDKKSKGCSEHELMDLYKDISNLNILSCIEIDRAKKISPVDATKELNKIREKHSLGKDEIKIKGEIKTVGIRPKFFKYLNGGKNYKFVKFNTGMDILNEVIDENIKRTQTNTNTLPLYKLLKNSGNKKVSRFVVDKIKNICMKFRYDVNRLFQSDMSHMDKMDEYLITKHLTISKIRNININNDVVYVLLKRISDEGNRFKEYKKLGLTMIRLLCETDKKMFFSCIEAKKKNNSYIIECGDCEDLTLYGVKFKKVTNTFKNKNLL